MAYKCPSCGAPYNGKRCRRCLYENFTEEIAHGGHTHKGEPLVVEEPVRRPIPRQDPFDCPPEPQKRKAATRRKASGGMSKWILVLVVILLINIVPGLIAMGLNSLEQSSYTYEYSWSAEPEEIVPAEPYTQSETERTVLYSDADFTITADLGDGQSLEPGDVIPIQVENNSRQDVNVIAQNVVANGWVLNEAFFYCSLDRDSAATGELIFDQQELALCGIDQIEELSLQLRIYNSDTYYDLVETGPISLLSRQDGGDAFDSQEATGTLLYQGEDVSIYLLGYQASSYAPDTVSEGELLFCVENRSDIALDVYANDCSVNGESISLSMYVEMPAKTRTIDAMYLFDLEDMESGVTALEDITSFQASFTVYNSATSADYTTDMLDLGEIPVVE